MVYAVALGLASAAAACSGPSQDDREPGQGAAQTATQGGGSTGAGALAPPKPGTVNNALAKQAVLEKWNLVRETFYGAGQASNLALAKKPTAKLPASSEVERCLNVCPGYYSDIVCHYYCWHPSYEEVSPNVRGCFSFIVGGAVKVPPSTSGISLPSVYPAIYDYCLYQKYDYAKSTEPVSNWNTPDEWKIPAYDPDLIAKNKSAGIRPGVLKWVDDNERDVFKHVMWTWYNVDAFSDADQQEVINKFYGVTDTTDCSKRPTTFSDPSDSTHCQVGKARAKSAHPRKTELEKFMNALSSP